MEPCGLPLWSTATEKERGYDAKKEKTHHRTKQTEQAPNGGLERKRNKEETVKRGHPGAGRKFAKRTGRETPITQADKSFF